jgi:hypothetical protein
VQLLDTPVYPLERFLDVEARRNERGRGRRLHEPERLEMACEPGGEPGKV